MKQNKDIQNWKLATFCLALICLLLMGIFIWQHTYAIPNYDNKGFNLSKSTVDQVADLGNGRATFCQTNPTVINGQQYQICETFIKLK